MGGPRVLVILAEGFEEVEALTPVDLLRRAGLSVVVAGLSSLHVKGARGVTVVCDAILSEISGTFDALVLPGGMPGAKNLAESPLVLDWVDRCVSNQVWVAAICAAPGRVLGDHGYLKGKRCTGYPESIDPCCGATVVNASVVVDGRILTSRGLATAPQFALRLIRELVGTEAAQRVAEATLLQKVADTN